MAEFLKLDYIIYLPLIFFLTTFYFLSSLTLSSMRFSAMITSLEALSMDPMSPGLSVMEVEGNYDDDDSILPSLGVL